MPHSFIFYIMIFLYAVTSIDTYFPRILKIHIYIINVNIRKRNISLFTQFPVK